MSKEFKYQKEDISFKKHHTTGTIPSPVGNFKNENKSKAERSFTKVKFNGYNP